MTKQTEHERAVDLARNAPPLGNDLRPIDREGGNFPWSSAGRPAGRDGAPGVPASGGTAERLRGQGGFPFADFQVPAGVLPGVPKGRR